MHKEISHTLFFKQSPKEVWDYLTKSELIAEWLMANDFKPVVGHKFQFRSNNKIDCENEGIAYCEVLKIIPLKHLSYSWKWGKEPGQRTLDSVVIWTLSEKKSGTELRLQHNGFTLLEDFISHSDGWIKIVNRFSEFLNTTRNANTKA